MLLTSPCLKIKPNAALSLHNLNMLCSLLFLISYNNIIISRKKTLLRRNLVFSGVHFRRKDVLPNCKEIPLSIAEHSCGTVWKCTPVSSKETTREKAAVLWCLELLGVFSNWRTSSNGPLAVCIEAQPSVISLQFNSAYDSHIFGRKTPSFHFPLPLTCSSDLSGSVYFQLRGLSFSRLKISVTNYLGVMGN